MRRRILALASLGLIAAAEPPGVPIAPRPPDTPPEQPSNRPMPLKGVHWLAQPSPGDIAKVMPPEDRIRTPDTRVVLGCTVTRSGRLSGCGIVVEEPPGHGIGAAALKLAPRFLMARRNDRGLPTAGRYVEVPFIFRSVDR